MKFDNEFFSLGYIDRLSYKETFIHNIDARVKLAISLVFIICVLSFPKYEVLSLIPFFLFPIVFLSIGEIPLSFIVKRLAIVFPFVFFIAIFNPIFEKKIAFYIFNIPIPYGILSFFSILIRFVLSVSMLILLVATTSFSGICYALKYFRVPEIFITQLLFLYRYIFVLLEEAMRMVRAKDMRSFGRKGTELKFYVKLVGTLLIRSILRAEKIYYAMLSRGFNGVMPYRKKRFFKRRDFVFLTVSVLLLYVFRFFDVIKLVGRIFVRGLS